MTPTEAHDTAVLLVAHMRQTADMAEQIDNAAHEIRYIARKSARTGFGNGIAIGIGATLIVGIIAMLLLGFCNHMHLPLG